MKRVLGLIIIAFLISGGTVGILYQEGFGGLSKKEEAVDISEQIAAKSDIEAAQAEEQDIAASYGEGTDETQTTEIAVDSATDDSLDPDIGALTVPDSGESTEEQPESEVTAEDVEEALGEETAAEEAKAEEEAKKEEEAASEKASKGPFYSVNVKGINGTLNMHKTANDKNDVIGSVGEGAKGYLIGKDPSGSRRLCYIDGKIVYLSKSYTELSEIDADDYPDALLDVTEKNAGEDFSIE